MRQEQQQRLKEIRQRLSHISSGPWRDTIRRENGEEIVKAILNHGGPFDPHCSMSVVNTAAAPTEKNVICWMGPAAGEKGDDLKDASFIAHAPEDIRWLLDLVEALSAVGSGDRPGRTAGDS